MTPEEYMYPGYVALPSPPGIPYEPGQDWQPEEVNLTLSDFADTLTEQERGMEEKVAYTVSVSFAPCGIPGCRGNEWVFMYDGLDGIEPLHCCDGVMPHVISNTVKGLTGYGLEEFKLLASLYDTRPLETVAFYQMPEEEGVR